MKDKDTQKEVTSILKRLWDDSHRYKSLKIGDLVMDTRKGTIGIIIGFKPGGLIYDQNLKDKGVEARLKINFNASETTDGTLLGKTPVAILQTLEPEPDNQNFYEFRIRYTSEKHLTRLEPDNGKYNEGLTLIKEHCSCECILECTPECSLYKFK